MNPFGTSISVLVVLLLSSVSQAKENPEIQPFGWINTEYHYSTSERRIAPQYGNDAAGVQQAALGLRGKKGKYHGVLVIGGSNLSNDDNAAESSQFSIRDAFFVYEDRAENNFKASFGAQPLLFSLKPNGFPGDRSIRASLEYGALNSLQVGFQGERSIKFDYFHEYFDLDLGFFDTNVQSSDGTDGSSFADNLMAQFKFKNILIDGTFANLGWQQRYLGQQTSADNSSTEDIDENRSIVAAGFGYENESLTLTVEYLNFDKAFALTDKNEETWVVEFDYKFSKYFWGYADWAEAAQRNVATQRYGLAYEISTQSTLQIEFNADRGLKSSGETYNSDGADIRYQYRL